MMNDAVIEENPLKVSERCDACGARAWVEVIMSSGPLLFCAHHGRELKDSYARTALEVRDYSQALYSSDS